MYRRCAAVGLSLSCLLVLTPGLASASTPDLRPLQLELASSFSPSNRANPGSELRAGGQRIAAASGRKSTGARPSGLAEAEQSLRQRALQSMLNASESTLDEGAAAAAPGMPQFRFERRGPAIRDFSRGYKEVCAKVSRKIWDEPNGRRIKFDIAGKPGVGIELPIR